jgi:hypothetical protein
LPVAVNACVWPFAILALPGETVIFESVVWLLELESLHPVRRPKARKTRQTDSIFTTCLNSQIDLLSLDCGGESIREC